MYRSSLQYQQLISRLARDSAAREERWKAITSDCPSELPELRRLIDTADYDTGIPVTHQIELYRSNRIDCYNVWVTERPEKNALVGVNTITWTTEYVSTAQRRFYFRVRQ